jgi:hypothetical protein
MLFVQVPLVADVLTMPPGTPIACQVCKHEPVLTFAGTVELAEGGRIRIFNGKTHQSMGFALPENFRGVTSSDGVIKNAPLTSVRPGLLARMTYQTIDGRHVPSAVLLLTINQCRALMAAEHISHSKDTDCPD